MKEEQKSRGWRQSVPRILIAAAGVVTAAGCTLSTPSHQIGGTTLPPATIEIKVPETSQAENQPAAPPATTGMPTEPQPAEQTGGADPAPAADHGISMPDGNSVTMHSNGNKAQYTILSAQAEPSSPDKSLIRLRVRVWSESNMFPGSFRLYAGDQHIAPVKSLNGMISGDETRDGDVEFEVDRSVKEATLAIKDGDDTRQLRLMLQ